LIAVPLHSRSAGAGALGFVRDEGRNRFHRADFALGEDLAVRSALALENARLYREAQDAVRSREDFLSVASHELKTPLTPLLLRLQSLERSLSKGKPEDLQLVHKAEDHLNRLKSLIEELLDVSRLKEGRLQLDLKPLSLSEVVGELVTEQEPTNAHRIVVHDALGEIRVLADRPRLEQVIRNLVDNAVKYSPDGGEVHVRMSTNSAGEAVLSVTDVGIGIPPAELPRVFERFYRANNASIRRFGGLGLGLYISREIVARHRGRIWVSSEMGKGSTFFVALPALFEARRQTGGDETELTDTGSTVIG
jgi:signal transduction histidine kinase